jgi:hypothetical protein
VEEARASILRRCIKSETKQNIQHGKTDPAGKETPGSPEETEGDPEELCGWQTTDLIP